jgi:Zn-dependent peptidase ImmA (M78 family)/DNA-binding XRE family transcriptional regulator
VATSPPAYVKPEILRWARESIGYALDDAARKIGVRTEKLAQAEKGEQLLTIRQAEKAAHVYERPLAALFLPAAPTEEAQEAQFRRLPGAPEPPWPPEMVALTRRVRAKQEAAAELYDLLDEDPPWPQALAQLRVERDRLPKMVRDALGIKFEEQASWRDPAGYTPLRHWVDAVESLGVLVMQDGTMPVDTLRGFASTHDVAPAIIINTQDDARARAFTILHEFGHLYLAAFSEPVDARTEQWCDEFAGEVLMPSQALEHAYASIEADDTLNAIDELALTFGVTPHAATIKAARTGLISQREAREIIESIDMRTRRTSPGGGNYYRNMLGHLGPAFVRLVFSALDSQALTYPVASGLLEVKVNNFDTLRRYTDKRADLP